MTQNKFVQKNFYQKNKFTNKKFENQAVMAYLFLSNQATSIKKLVLDTKNIIVKVCRLFLKSVRLRVHLNLRNCSYGCLNNLPKFF